MPQSISFQILINNCGGFNIYLLIQAFTADGDCNHEIKRCLFLGRKAMTNLDSMLKNITLRHYFADKGPSNQSYVFSCMDVRVGL